MNRLKYFTLILFISISGIYLFGCTDSDDNHTPGIYGKVIDSSGNIAVNVNVNYIFYTNSNSLVLSLSILYGLPSQNIVTLKVFDPFDNEVVTLVDSQLQNAGYYSIYFNSPVTNGIYTYKLWKGDSLSIGSFFIRDDDIDRLAQKNPLLTTDHSGQFFIDNSLFGIGKTIGLETITDSITIVLSKTGYRNFTQTFHVDTTKAIERTFTLTAN